MAKKKKKRCDLKYEFSLFPQERTPTRSCLLLSRSSRSLVLLNTTHFLRSVLLFFPLLPCGCDLGLQALSDQTVLGLEFLCHKDVVVDEAKPSALATTKLGPETIQEDRLGILDLVHLGQPFLDLGFGDTSSSLMQNINNLWLAKERALVF